MQEMVRLLGVVGPFGIVFLFLFKKLIIFETYFFKTKTE